MSSKTIAMIAVVLVVALGFAGAAGLFRSDDAGELATSGAAGEADFAVAWAQQPRVDLGIDPEGASVVVVKFNDFECPACRQAEIQYKPVLDRFAQSHPGAVKYVIKDWPLDSSCNFHMMSTVRGHEAACDASAAARMAQDRGQYQEMVDWIYANQGVTQAALREATQRILGVTDFEAEYARKLPDIRKDISDGGALNIQSTPTYFINGVRVGGLPPQSFERAIALEIEAAAGQQAQPQ